MEDRAERTEHVSSFSRSTPGLGESIAVSAAVEARAIPERLRLPSDYVDSDVIMVCRQVLRLATRVSAGQRR